MIEPKPEPASAAAAIKPKIEKDAVIDTKGEGFPKQGVPRGDLILIASIMIILLILGIIFSVYYFKNRGKTLDEKYLETLKGQGGDDAVLYNGFAFVKNDGLWNTRWAFEDKLYNLRFHFTPPEVADVPVYGNISSQFNKADMYILFDPEFKDPKYVALSSFELNINLIQAIQANPTAACTSNTSVECAIRPIVECNSSDRPVIYLKEDSPNVILFNGNCMVIQGQGEELLKAVDKVLYLWLKII
jgi:hypothetical protein